MTKIERQTQYASQLERKNRRRKVKILHSRGGLAPGRDGSLYRPQKQRVIRLFLVTQRMNSIQHRAFRLRQAAGKQKSRPETSANRLVVVVCRSHFSTSYPYSTPRRAQRRHEIERFSRNTDVGGRGYHHRGTRAGD